MPPSHRENTRLPPQALHSRPMDHRINALSPAGRRLRQRILAGVTQVGEAGLQAGLDATAPCLDVRAVLPDVGGARLVERCEPPKAGLTRARQVLQMLLRAGPHALAVSFEGTPGPDVGRAKPRHHPVLRRRLRLLRRRARPAQHRRGTHRQNVSEHESSSHPSSRRVCSQCPARDYSPGPAFTQDGSATCGSGPRQAAGAGPSRGHRGRLR